jgi:hypothetical protein
MLWLSQWMQAFSTTARDAYALRMQMQMHAARQERGR